MIDPTPPTPSSWYAAPWWTAIMGVGQLLAAVFAAWAAIVAKRAAKAAEASVEVTKQTALAADSSSRHRDRAYVALSNSSGPNHYAVGTPINLTFLFKNVGVTPAYKVRFGALISIVDKVPTEVFLDEQLSHLSTMAPLAPSIEIPVHCSTTEDGELLAFSQQGIIGLQKGESIAVASARIIYEDAFGEEHITRVAFQFHPSIMAFRLAPFYNSMT